MLGFGSYHVHHALWIKQWLTPFVPQGENPSPAPFLPPWQNVVMEWHTTACISAGKLSLLHLLFCSRVVGCFAHSKSLVCQLGMEHHPGVQALEPMVLLGFSSQAPGAGFVHCCLLFTGIANWDTFSSFRRSKGFGDFQHWWYKSLHKQLGCESGFFSVEV